MNDNVGFNAGCREAQYEARMVESELRWERNENEFWSCFGKVVTIRYKIDEPTIEKAEAILKAFQGGLGTFCDRVQFVFDNTMESDTDWQVTGVDGHAVDAMEELCVAVFCDDCTPEKADKVIQDYINDMEVA